MHCFYKGRSNKAFTLPDGEVVILRPMTYYSMPDGAQFGGVVNLVRVGNPKGKVVDLSSHTGTMVRQSARSVPAKPAPQRIYEGLTYATAVTVKPVGRPGSPKDNAPVPIIVEEKKKPAADMKAEKAAEKRAEAEVAPAPEPPVEPEPKSAPEPKPETEPEPMQESPEQEQEPAKKVAPKKKAPPKSK